MSHPSLKIRTTAARLTAGIAALLSVGLAAAADAPAAPGVTALLCGHLIDTAAGKMLGETTIVIESGRIREVLSGNQAPAGATAIDLKSQTCMPGLIDAHTHLTGQTSRSEYVDKFHWNVADYAIRSTVYARRTLLAGFTTVRNLGDGANESAALRDAINAGVVPGPRIYTAGKAIGTTGGHADPYNGYRQDLAKDLGPVDGIINGPEDAVKAVREHYKLGDDVIKIMPSGGVLDEGASGDNSQMTLEEIRAIVSTAHDYGFTVAAHAHGAEAIRRAVVGGVDSIEHGTFMDAEDMKLMVEHGTWYVPTIIAGDFVARTAKIPGYYPPQVAAKAMAIGPLIQATAGRAYKAHVKIAFGTDAAVYPHGQNAHEFELMVGAGIPPMYAIQAATVNAATLLRHDKDLGSVSAGKIADVVAVPGNPIDDISIMKRVSFVMKAGVVYKLNSVPVDTEL
ncbi:MAG TPA: amidohydrolase family protein [Steroidobacteraceae bacterium]|nr:amidohydrolase family protein [Steroidobacteraceae bacterium]